jgi:hypothetical protein
VIGADCVVPTAAVAFKSGISISSLARTHLSQDSSVGIVTDYGLDDRGIGFRFLVG